MASGQTRYRRTGPFYAYPAREEHPEFLAPHRTFRAAARGGIRGESRHRGETRALARLASQYGHGFAAERRGSSVGAGDFGARVDHHNTGLHTRHRSAVAGSTPAIPCALKVIVFHVKREGKGSPRLRTSFYGRSMTSVAQPNRFAPTGTPV